jgi:superfamily II DNA or RNA helicase
MTQANNDIKIKVPPGVNVRYYQKKAYEKWVENQHCGIFAMATGTGKTVTSLYCVYKELSDTELNNISAQPHLLILVPTQPLALQWNEQVLAWGFSKIYQVHSATNWRAELHNLFNDFQYGLDDEFVIIATYKSFTHPDFQRMVASIPADTILIADEAHNVGQKQVKEVIGKLSNLKRIGLTATPKRIYDPEGTKDVEAFFNDAEPYCFSYYMEDAIADGRLCKYYYYPVLVELDSSELEDYIKLSIKLAKLFGSTGDSQVKESYERLLIKRKRIINQANGKIAALGEIIDKLKLTGETIKYCFTYAPAGDLDIDANHETSENKRIIRQMQKIFQARVPGIRTHAYLGETEAREEVLDSFEKGEIDVLLAINCLDEGVDIPRTAIAIFTSSSGNPRQYIQRRGRVLRQHKDKSFAIIFDMVVIPQIFDHQREEEYFKVERNIVKNELMRVGYFAKLSENFYEARDVLEPACRYYHLNIDSIIKDLEHDN